MPETFILYRFFFEWLGEVKNYPVSTNAWLCCWNETFNSLKESERDELLTIIYQNKFNELTINECNKKYRRLLGFYTNFRDDVVTKGTELYDLKKEYDENPT